MGNGVYFKMIGCCHSNKNLKNKDIDIVENLKNYINFKNKLDEQHINEYEVHNKNEAKIIETKSKKSSRSESQNKVKQIGDNSSNIQNISICNNTFQMNNSNLIKNNLVKKKAESNIFFFNNPIDDIRFKNVKFNNNLRDIYIDIKTKLILFCELFS